MRIALAAPRGGRHTAGMPEFRAPPTTIFTRMSALATELGAINLGQGFPDLKEPPELLAAAQRALVEHPNQYPPMCGLGELRRAIVDFYAREQGLALREDEVVVTSGATEALAAAILAVIRPGDEAILLQPFYDAYAPLVERAGGTVRIVSLAPPGWSVPLDELAAAITPATRLIILNAALGGTYPNGVNGVTSPYYGLPQSTVDKIKAGNVEIEVDWVRVTSN